MKLIKVPPPTHFMETGKSQQRTKNVKITKVNNSELRSSVTNWINGGKFANGTLFLCLFRTCAFG